MHEIEMNVDHALTKPGARRPYTIICVHCSFCILLFACVCVCAHTCIYVREMMRKMLNEALYL